MPNWVLNIGRPIADSVKEVYLRDMETLKQPPLVMIRGVKVDTLPIRIVPPKNND